LTIIGRDKHWSHLLGLG
jgi:hypothetical protein